MNKSDFCKAGNLLEKLGKMGDIQRVLKKDNVEFKLTFRAINEPLNGEIEFTVSKVDFWNEFHSKVPPEEVQNQLLEVLDGIHLFFITELEKLGLSLPEERKELEDA